MGGGDGLEMLMVGASAIGLCSVLLLNGLEYLPVLIKDLERHLEEGGHSGDIYPHLASWYLPLSIGPFRGRLHHITSHH